MEAPAFMRGQERFSAPENVAALITRFSAGDREIPGLKGGVRTVSSLRDSDLFPLANSTGKYQVSFSRTL